MKKLRETLRQCTPPYFWEAAKSIYKKLNINEQCAISTDKINCIGNYASWDKARTQCDGYDDNLILEKVLASTLKIKNGEAVFERDSVLFDDLHYSWPTLTAIMFASARVGGKLNLLDFGGSLGSTYFQNRIFLSNIQYIRWNIVEQQHYVEAGQKYIQNEILHFYFAIEQCIESNTINAILISSVLQYLPDPYDILDRLIRCKAETIIIDRTPYVNENENEVIKIQYIPESIYKSSYPIRFFNENEIVEYIISSGYKLLEKFNSFDKLDEDATWKGHIFVRK